MPGIFGKPEHGDNMGTASPLSQERQARRGDDDEKNGAQVQTTVVPLSPRLLDLPTAAAYLGLSPWTVRDLEAAGSLARVRIPLPNAGELRKLLFDRVDLDRLIEAWKDGR